MRCLGFGNRWINWIKACLTSATISVLVNGSPSREFNPERGVRQGDPLSPFFFILAAEGLNVLINRALSSGCFKGVKLGNNDVVDLSGLKINFQKSNLFGIGFEENIVANMAAKFGCKPGNFPSNYLGIPIGVKMHKSNEWQSVVDKFKKHLSD
ncbi:uncharacterized protein [Rutidosis leptorrhynchoides]|uniref:uncharacterized protein n=1 Tax=Rutidosis leptorrhynchoides TaxID=125765 RepID=UPI003A9A5744